MTTAPGRNRRTSHAYLRSWARLAGRGCRSGGVFPDPDRAPPGSRTGRLGYRALHRLARRGAGNLCRLRHALSRARQRFQQRAADHQWRHQHDRLCSARPSVRDRPGRTGHAWRARPAGGGMGGRAPEQRSTPTRRSGLAAQISAWKSGGSQSLRGRCRNCTKRTLHYDWAATSSTSKVSVAPFGIRLPTAHLSLQWNRATGDRLHAPHRHPIVWAVAMIGQAATFQGAARNWPRLTSPRRRWPANAGCSPSRRARRS